MKLIVTGGTGFVGTALVSALVIRGHEVRVIDRHVRTHEPLAGVEYLQADLMSDRLKPEWFDGVDAVIHLAGKNILGFWTQAHKQALIDSRVVTARRLVEVIERLPSDRQPKSIISANAIGIYGDRGDAVLSETSAPGTDFLSKLCLQWQDVWRPLSDRGVRVVSIRTGIVLDASGGMLAKLLTPFKLGLGAVLGTGKQWFSWISLTDLISVYLLAIENEAIEGPVNAVSPAPLRNHAFTKQLADALGRPAFLRVPVFAIRLVAREATAAVLSSQRVKPVVLESLHFVYEHPTIKDVIQSNTTT